MKVVIIEDEELAARRLEGMIRDCDGSVEVIAKLESVEESVTWFRNHPSPDLIFLDIHLPKLKGMNFLRTLQNRPQVIITTAYNEYAVEGFELNVVDYLLKPIDKDELIEAIKKLNKRKESIQKSQIDNLYQIHKNKVIDKIAISTNDGLQFISLLNIIRIEASGSYCNFYLIDGSKILLSKKLGDVEEILIHNSDFFRAHKSNMINLKYVEKYIKGDGGEIQMIDKTIITLSRAKKAEFLELFAKI